MTPTNESCPICGLNCEANVKKVWPDARSRKGIVTFKWSIWKDDSLLHGTLLAHGHPIQAEAWHSAAQNPRVKAARMRESIDAAAKEVASWSPAKREAADVTSPELEPPSRYAEAMREAGKAAEMSVEEVFCMKRDPETNFACALTPGHRGRHDSKALPPAPVEAGPQPMCMHDFSTDYCPDCSIIERELRMGIASPPPAAESGEPTCHICGWAASDCSCAGTKDIRIQEAYERGFNACREMAALQIVGFVDTSMVLSAVTAMRNLKSEGK